MIIKLNTICHFNNSGKKMESKWKAPHISVYVRLQLPLFFWATDRITAFMSREDRMFLFCYSILSGHLSFFFSLDGGRQKGSESVHHCLSNNPAGSSQIRSCDASFAAPKRSPIPASNFPFFPSHFFPLTFCCRSFIPFERVKQGKALSSGKLRNQTVLWQHSTVSSGLWSPCSQLLGTATLVHLYFGSRSFQSRGPSLCHHSIIMLHGFLLPVLPVKQIKSQIPDHHASPPSPMTLSSVWTWHLLWNANSWLAVRASRLWVGPLWGFFSHGGRHAHSQADRQVGIQTYWHTGRLKVVMCETCGQLT